MFEILSTELEPGGSYKVRLQITSKSIGTIEFETSLPADDHAHLQTVVREQLLRFGQELEKFCAG